MKKVILFTLLLAGSSLFAQKISDIDKMLDGIKPHESKCLELSNERKGTYDILMNYTTDKTVRPYPQLSLLLDSMNLECEEIAEIRREINREKDAILQTAGDKKIKKNSAAYDRLQLVTKEKAEVDRRINVYSEKNRKYSAQFDNLIMLHKISITSYGDYYEEFIEEVESREDLLAEQGSKLGPLKARVDNEEDEEAKSREFQDAVHELSTVHGNAQSKITLIQNFQSRLETTRPDELIVIGPAVPPPYEINLMLKELKALDELFIAFDLFHAELND